ncbi:MAG: transcription termination factor NusA [Planctomycetes bacterium]|nr:transcription termination factor NusA [Planctomycetota bacterium]
MNGEILRLVDTIHRDKDIEKEIIFQGIEAALLSAVKKKWGESEDVRVVIDRATGITKAIGDGKEVVLEDLGRLAAMTGKQVLLQKIREAERDKIYGDYEQKLNKLVAGVVQRQEGPNLIVNLGKVEGLLPRSEQAPGEKFRVGERIKVLIKDIKKNTNRVKITLSRTSPLLVKALFTLEVPEIAEKVIEIMEIVREPGYRTKIAVTTYDHNVDCVGACVGVRGSRIKNIVDELFGEKIDIVRWNDSIEVLIMNALKPAEITSIDLDFDAKKAVVYVKPDQQSLAIGKRGQNVRLASRLAKWDLDIVTVTDAEIEKLKKGETPAGTPVHSTETESAGGGSLQGAAQPSGAEGSEQSAGAVRETDEVLPEAQEERDTVGAASSATGAPASEALPADPGTPGGVTEGQGVQGLSGPEEAAAR